MPQPTREFYEKLPAKRMSAAAVILDDKGKILLVKPSYREDWLPPGGIVERGESPLEACRRETREETGLDISVERLLAVDHCADDGLKTEHVAFVFFGGVAGQDARPSGAASGGEIERAEFIERTRFDELLIPLVAERLRMALAALDSGQTAYLEDQKPVCANR